MLRLSCALCQLRTAARVIAHSCTGVSPWKCSNMVCSILYGCWLLCTGLREYGWPGICFWLASPKRDCQQGKTEIEGQQRGHNGDSLSQPLTQNLAKFADLKFCHPCSADYACYMLLVEQLDTRSECPVLIAVTLTRESRWWITKDILNLVNNVMSFWIFFTFIHPAYISYPMLSFVNNNVPILGDMSGLWPVCRYGRQQYLMMLRSSWLAVTMLRYIGLTKSVNQTCLWLKPLHWTPTDSFGFS